MEKVYNKIARFSMFAAINVRGATSTPLSLHRCYISKMDS